MNGRTIFGIALIVIGIIALVYQGSLTRRTSALDIGPVSNQRRTPNHPGSPVIGIIAVISGVAVLALGRGKSN